MTDTTETENKPPNWLAMESIVPIENVTKITSLSRDTISRRYPHLVKRLSPRRKGMRLSDALAIARGDVTAAVE
jgi:hypothetical protein